MTDQDAAPRPRTHAAVPPRHTGALYINRVERRTFDGDCEFLRAPHHRAAIGTYLSDLLLPHGLDLNEDLLAAGAGHSYGEMGAELVGSVVGADEPVDLLVVAFNVPDVRPGRATATYLSHVCPGNPQSFAICDQGVAAAYTGLRLVREYVGSGACRRALLLVLEQTTLHYQVPGPVELPARHAGVALLCTGRPGAAGTVRLDGVRVRTEVGPGQAAGLLATEFAEQLLRHGDATTLVAGNGFDPGDLPAGAHRGPAGQPLTAAWWELAAEAPGRAVVLADYEPSLRYLCAATFYWGVA
ncbi:2-hydroxy-acid oxidase [Dactylosporangium sp. CA-233914]|uniref:2-hydroxy-acid oxidase n=1 Tax=Dactylosporangium sp. CA-233914 TaxID=3239934 RepID=UPI003D916D9C